MDDVSVKTQTISLTHDLEMFYYLWQPAGGAKTGVLLLHGFGEHAGRYDKLARYLARRSIVVVAPDARGHGRTGGQRGHILRFDQYLDDLDAFRARIRAELPEVENWYILGHSMGGLVALRYALRNQRLYKGLALSNPLLGLALEVPLIKAVAGRLLSRVWPTLSMGNEVNPEHLSRNQEVGKAYMADPLVHHKVSARWFTELLVAMDDALARAPRGLELRTLFLISTADRLTDCETSQTLFNRLTVKKKTLKVYEGLYHEIFNEYDHEAIYAELADWLERT